LTGRSRYMALEDSILAEEKARQDEIAFCWSRIAMLQEGRISDIGLMARVIEGIRNSMGEEELPQEKSATFAKEC
jgi:hypothetical protein